MSAEPPAGWFDKTMIVYSAPPDPAHAIAPTIVVGRDALGADETFREYCNRQVDTFRASLPGYVREGEQPGQVHGFDAFQIRFTWRSAGGALRQQVFFVAAGGGMIVTYTGTAAAEDFAAFEVLFERSLATLRIDG
ncbi:MAG: DcrB-related protein [Janthinobacterium lividum]